MTEPRKEHNLLRSAGAMGIATFLSRIFGLVREQVFAFFFGAGFETDAFQIAFRIPNLFRDLFAEGAMSSAFIPAFVRVRTEKSDRDAWRLAGLVFRVLGWGISILTVIGILGVPWLVSLYASAYKALPGKFELTVTLTREIFPFFPLVVLAAAYMGVLNACQAFFIPAFSSALFNIISTLVGVSLSFVMPKFGYRPIEGMAIGVVVGGVAQAFSQLPLLYKKGYFWPKKVPTDTHWSQDPNLRRMLLLMVPGTLGLAATQINILVNSVFATSSGPGAVSWLNYAFRLMQFPIGVFGVSFAAATLPQASKNWVDKNWQATADTVRDSLRQVLAVNIPAAAGLAFLGEPIIRMIFQYGRFSSADAAATAKALAAYAIGLAAYSLVKVLAPVFYAMENATIPVISSVLSVALNLLFNFFLVHRLGYWGLALGTSMTAMVNALFLLVVFEKRLKAKGAEFSLFQLIRFSGAVLLVALAMGFGCHWVSVGMGTFLDPVLGTGLFSRFFNVGISVSFGVLLVVFLGKVFGVRELYEITLKILNRILSKLRIRHD